MSQTHRAHPYPERWLHAIPETSAAAAWSLLDQPVPFPLTSRVALGAHDAHDLGRHHEAYGPRPSAVGAYGKALVEALAESGLTGHGGAHFPVARKWRTALAAGGDGIVVANCAEGEPASAKDAALLQLRPHLVLDGLALAAEAMGTRQGVVWLHEGDEASRAAVLRAVEERRSAGDLNLSVRIASAPNHYLSGESSAVARALSGGPALPYLARQPAAASGVGGRATVVHNAETLARVALVARHGGQAQPAGPLLTIVGRSGRVVLPTRPAETLAEAVARSEVAAGTWHAVLVGGYGGSWLPWADVAGLAIDGPGLGRWGASTGAGVVAPLETYACGLAETARIVGYLAESSARQCGPCLFGLPALEELVHRLASGDGNRRTMKTLERYSAEINGRGACHHPDGAVRLVATALRTFHADVRHHLEHGPCEGIAVPALLPLPDPA